MKLINEERGVAAYRYKETIDNIVKYINIKIKDFSSKNNIKDEETIKLIIPYSITNDIDIVEKEGLTITVNVIFHNMQDDLNNFHGSGKIMLQKNVFITEKGKLNKCNLDLICYANSAGYLYEKTFYSTIYHEINHLYDFFGQFKNKNGQINNVKYATKDISRKMTKIASDIKIDLLEFESIEQADKIADYFYYILYHLWSDTELNSFISGVYGELKTMDSERKNFNKDIKNTEAYKIYKNIKLELPYIFVFEDYIIEIINDAFKKNDFIIGKTEKTFRKNFYEKTQLKLNKLYKGITRVASLYYDSVEDSKIIAEDYSNKYGNCIIEGKIIEVKPEPRKFNYLLKNVK